MPQLRESLWNTDVPADGCSLTGLSEEGASLITQYPWPGNIREMRNFCQRLSILTPNPLATPADILKVLPDTAATTTPNEPEKTDRSTPGDLSLIHI